MSRDKVQAQFGPGAAAYARSKVHAQGASLERLITLVQPQSSWRVLDVATGAGHTALALAPHVSQVLATDITQSMLAQTRELAVERSLSNVGILQVDALELPFARDSFACVTCRIAAHHFPDIGRFLAAAAKVLRPGGMLAVVDNIVPGSRRRGRVARERRAAGEYVNAFEKLRDPSHERCLSLDEWAEAYHATGLELTHQETLFKMIDFSSWAARMRVSPRNETRLRAMLVQAPPPVQAFLTPAGAGDRISFRLTEAILIGKR